MSDAADPTSAPHEYGHAYYRQNVTPTEDSIFGRWLVETGVGKKLTAASRGRFAAAYGQNDESFAVIAQSLLMGTLEQEGKIRMVDVFADHADALNEHRRFMNVLTDELGRAPLPIIGMFKNLLAPARTPDRRTGRRDTLSNAAKAPEKYQLDSSSQKKYAESEEAKNNGIHSARNEGQGLEPVPEGSPGHETDQGAVRREAGLAGGTTQRVAAEDFHSALEKAKPEIKHTGFVEFKEADDDYRATPNDNYQTEPQPRRSPQGESCRGWRPGQPARTINIRYVNPPGAQGLPER